MNLRTNPTCSQRNAHWEALAEAVVGAAVAPKASKKSKRGGGNRGRTASQKTRPPPPPPPLSSPPSPNQAKEGRIAEMVEGDERACGDSITQSPTPLSLNIPPPSTQPQSNVFNEQLAHNEKELNKIAGPIGLQSDDEITRSTRPQSEDESEDLNRIQISQSTLLKVAKGKRPTPSLEDIDVWYQVRVQIQTLIGTKILSLFEVYLKVFRKEASFIEISDYIIAKFKRLEANQLTNEVRVLYTNVGNPITRVNIYRIKEIVLIIEKPANNFKELIKIVKSLF